MTPGPGRLYPTVSAHLREAMETGIPSVSHRSEEYMTIHRNTVDQLKELLDIPHGYHVFFSGSATEWMERIIQNCAAEHSLHFVNGAFSGRFHSIAVELGKKAEKVSVSPGQGFQNLTQPVTPETELICLTRNETSTGVSLPPLTLRELREKYPSVLIALDMVSDVPCIHTPLLQVDCAFFSVQKGFGLPAGLGVLILNDRCLEKSRSLHGSGYYTGGFHSFPSLLKYAEKNQTPETPNVLAIYLLGKICRDMIERGIDRIREDIRFRAETIYSCFDRHHLLSPFVKEQKFRSSTVAVADVSGGSASLIRHLKEKGFTIGAGYGKRKTDQIRIANFPAHSRQDVEKVCELMGKL